MLASKTQVLLGATLFCTVFAQNGPLEQNGQTTASAVGSSGQSQPHTPSTRTQPTHAGTTLNAVSPSFEWWYKQTVSEKVSIISLIFDSDDHFTYWTVIPPSTTFNTSLAISTYGFDSTPTSTTAANGDVYTYSNYGAKPKYVAASTTALFLDAYKQPTATKGYNQSSLPDVQATPPPAQIVIPGAGTTISPGTPFVYFTAYEVVATNCAPARTGSKSCSVSSTTKQLNAPFVFEYTGPDPASVKDFSAAVTGKLDPAFPAFANVSSAVAGTWAAKPTVIVVVVRIIVGEAVLAAHVEKSATELDVPTQYQTLQPTKLQDNDSDVGKVPAVTTTVTTRKQPPGLPLANGSPTPTSPQQAGQPSSNDSPGDYVATGIGLTHATPAQTRTANADDSVQSSSTGGEAATSSRVGYTPGNTASSISSGTALSALCLSGLFLIAHAFG